MKVDQTDMTKPIKHAKDDPEKLHDFKHDIFLAGPPDRRVSEPYRQMFKDAFPELNIYDWETYTGADYQDRNHQAMRDSFMFVGFVPEFPLPALGEEIGYFYCSHEHRIKHCRRGLQLNYQHRQIKFSDLAGPHSEAQIPEFVPEISPPINPIVLIWPDEIDEKTGELKAKLTLKTYVQVADIMKTTQGAIDLVTCNLAWLKRWKKDFYPHIKEGYEYHQLDAALKRNYELREKDPFFELPEIRDMGAEDIRPEVPRFPGLHKKIPNDQGLDEDPYLLSHHPFKKDGPYPGPKKTGI